MALTPSFSARSTLTHADIAVAVVASSSTVWTSASAHCTHLSLVTSPPASDLAASEMAPASALVCSGDRARSARSFCARVMADAAMFGFRDEHANSMGRKMSCEGGGRRVGRVSGRLDLGTLNVWICRLVCRWRAGAHLLACYRRWIDRERVNGL